MEVIRTKHLDMFTFTHATPMQKKLDEPYQPSKSSKRIHMGM